MDNTGHMRALEETFDQQFFDETIQAGLDRWCADFRNFLCKSEEEQLAIAVEDVMSHRNSHNRKNDYFEKFMSL